MIVKEAPNTAVNQALSYARDELRLAKMLVTHAMHLAQSADTDWNGNKENHPFDQKGMEIHGIHVNAWEIDAKITSAINRIDGII